MPQGQVPGYPPPANVPNSHSSHGTDGVSGVKNLRSCVLDFCVMPVVFLYGFNLWIDPGFIFESCS